MYKKFRRAGCAVIGCHRTPRPKAVQGKRVVYITCSEQAAGGGCCSVLQGDLSV